MQRDMGSERAAARSASRRPFGATARARRRIVSAVFAFVVMVPVAAQALVAETPTPTDSPDHGIGEFGRVNRAMIASPANQ